MVSFNKQNEVVIFLELRGISVPDQLAQPSF